MKLIIFALILLSSLNLSAKVYIQVGQANIKKNLLALTPMKFFGTAGIYPEHRKVGHTLYTTIYNDLDVSSYFQFIDRKSYLENVEKAGLKPKSVDLKSGFDFSDWTSLGADFLIKSGYSLSRSSVELSVYVYHVPTQKLVFGKKYSNQRKFVRKLAHRFANDVLEKLTGKRGMFESRIVVSSNRAGGRNKEIFLMDWDGENVRQLTRHKSISISPAISEDGSQVAYTTYAWHKRWKSRNPDLFIYDVKTRKRKVISYHRGINSGAAFIPGTNDLLLNISKQLKNQKRSTTDIFRITRTGKKKGRYTYGPRGVMNVEPAISPDGKRVAFSSDRSGRPMIYVMPLAPGAKAKRVIFAGWYNSTPTWSPDGKKIAFAGYDKDLKHYDIFLMNSDGHNLTRLTTAKKVTGKKYSNNEDPVFSPDGRHVMFTSDRTGNKQIYLVNIDGSNERRLTLDRFNYYKPKWSKNIQ